MFKSITSRYLLLSIAAISLMAGYIYVDFLFTRKLKGEAGRINLIGRERMLTLAAAFDIYRVVEFQPSTEKDALLEKAGKAMKEYEETLYGLKTGNDLLGLKPVHRDDTQSIRILADLIDFWEKKQKPTFLTLQNLPPDRKAQACASCHSTIHENLLKIETLIKSLERGYETQLRRFDTFRLYAFGAFLVIVALIFFYVKQKIVLQLVRLRDAVSALGRGNLTMRVDVNNKDEIGSLAADFNRMAVTLESTLNEKQAHIIDLWMLADTSKLLVSTPELKNIFGSICNIAVKDFELKMAWLGIKLEGGPDIEGVGLSGFNKEADELSAWDIFNKTGRHTARALETKTPNIVNHSTANIELSAWMETASKIGFNSSMSLPLISSEGIAFGVLNLYGGKPDFFAGEKENLFQIFANQSAAAIENRMLIEGLEKKVAARTRELENALTQANAATKAKSDLIANMSHELKTPVSIISGYTTLLHEQFFGELNERQEEFVISITDSSAHLLGLINSLLDIARIESAAIEIKTSKFSLSGALERLVAMFTEDAMKRCLDLRLKMDGSAEIEIEADAGVVNQIMLNLLSNAVKFTPDGGTITVRARSIPDEELKSIDPLENRCKYIEISVEDTGIGIKPEDMPRLFTEFTQLESPYTKRYGGTGLGLAITKKFVELLGGRIWVETEFGKGSKFIFVLPVAPLSPQTEAFQRKTVNHGQVMNL